MACISKLDSVTATLKGHRLNISVYPTQSDPEILYMRMKTATRRQQETEIGQYEIGEMRTKLQRDQRDLWCGKMEG